MSLFHLMTYPLSGPSLPLALAAAGSLTGPSQEEPVGHSIVALWEVGNDQIFPSISVSQNKKHSEECCLGEAWSPFSNPYSSPASSRGGD